VSGDADEPGTSAFLSELGVRPLPPLTAPFDPGYDPATLEAHLEQSAHLMASLKLSMASWLVADERATRRKLAAAREHGVPVTTGGGPFEVAVAQGRLEPYLDLCGELGFSRIECGAGFTEMTMPPDDVVAAARRRGLEVQFELGQKHAGSFTAETVGDLVEVGRRWLDAGAVQLVVEARESAESVGLFDASGMLDTTLADRLAAAFGLDVLLYEAPNKPSQFALLDHLGPEVRLCNVRLEELLRVEIYRRGLHSDAFRHERLRPQRPAT
jgi:phosphosulfolactate synthase